MDGWTLWSYFGREAGLSKPYICVSCRLRAAGGWKAPTAAAKQRRAHGRCMVLKNELQIQSQIHKSMRSVAKRSQGKSERSGLAAETH